MPQEIIGRHVVNSPVPVPSPIHQPRSAVPDGDVLHLNELVDIVRVRLGIDSALPDDAILVALKAITSCTQPRERWRAAFDSNLGHWLALKGVDLNSALNMLLAMLPKPRM